MDTGTRKRRAGLVLMIAGILCIAAGILWLEYNLMEDRRAGVRAEAVMEQLAQYQEQQTDPGVDYLLVPEMEMPTVEIDGYRYIGVISVPVLDLTLPVMDDWSYPQLKIGPCRYKGSAYLNNMILCAHNYTTHFGRLSNLRVGDEITFTDVDGNEFLYEVAELETLAGTAVEQMQSGDWDLTLFTCTLSGQTRVTVRCNALMDSEFPWTE